MVSVRVLVVGLAAWAASCSPPTAPEGEVGTSGSLSGPAAAIVELTNTQRVRAGLVALRPHARLAEAAQIHAEQLARAGRLEHTLSGAPYPRLEDRLAAAGYQWRAVGENLAARQQSAAHAVDTWMSSSPHRANILNTSFTEMGGGYATDSVGRPYYVQVFGRPGS